MLTLKTLRSQKEGMGMKTFKQCQGCLERGEDVQERFFLISLDQYCDDCFTVKDGKLYARLTRFDEDRLNEEEESER